VKQKQPRQRCLEHMLDKSQRAISAAKTHLAEGDYDFASSRAYYAVFYLLQAALLTKDLTFSKHSAVISAFNQHFVKTGAFPKEFGRKIDRLFRDRQIGDYDYELAISDEEAQEDVTDAEKIANLLEEWLKEKQHIL